MPDGRTPPAPRRKTGGAQLSHTLLDVSNKLAATEGLGDALKSIRDICTALRLRARLGVPARSGHQ